MLYILLYSAQKETAFHTSKSITSAADVIIIRFLNDKMYLKLDAVGVLFFLEQSGTLREIIDNGPDEHLGV